MIFSNDIPYPICLPPRDLRWSTVSDASSADSTGVTINDTGISIAVVRIHKHWVIYNDLTATSLEIIFFCNRDIIPNPDEPHARF